MASGPFNELMDRVRSGSDSAVLELVNQCSGPVYRAIRSRLQRKFRASLDSADVAQAVWTSLLVGTLRDREFDTLDDLVRFLVRVASNKVVDQCERRRGAQRKGLLREVSCEEGADQRAPSPEATPSRTVSAREELSRVFRGCSARDREILQYYAQGLTFPEIAERLSMNAGSVRRIVHQFLVKLKAREHDSRP